MPRNVRTLLLSEAILGSDHGGACSMTPPTRLTSFADLPTWEEVKEGGRDIAKANSTLTILCKACAMPLNVERAATAAVVLR